MIKPTAQELGEIDRILLHQFEESSSRGSAPLVPAQELLRIQDEPEPKEGRCSRPPLRTASGEDSDLRYFWMVAPALARRLYDAGVEISQIIKYLHLDEIHPSLTAARRKTYRLLDLNGVRRVRPRLLLLEYEPSDDLPSNRSRRQRGKNER